MNNRFALELIIGITMLIAVLLFGTPGLVVLVLLSAHPFMHKKMDETEKLLFYRVGNYTAGAVLVAAVIIFAFSEIAINGILLGQKWFGLLLAVFIGAHGAAGLFLSRKDGKEISNF